MLRITTFALTSSLWRTSALRAHLAESAVTSTLYIGAVEQGAQHVVYGTRFDALAVDKLFMATQDDKDY